MKQFVNKKNEDVAKTILALSEATGWPKWYAKNIILWRRAKGLVWNVFEARDEVRS